MPAGPHFRGAVDRSSTLERTGPGCRQSHPAQNSIDLAARLEANAPREAAASASVFPGAIRRPQSGKRYNIRALAVGDHSPRQRGVTGVYLACPRFGKTTRRPAAARGGGVGPVAGATSCATLALSLSAPGMAAAINVDAPNLPGSGEAPCPGELATTHVYGIAPEQFACLRTARLLAGRCVRHRASGRRRRPPRLPLKRPHERP